MCLLCVDRNDAKLSVSANRVMIHSPNDETKTIPIETLENITILGNAQITTQCVHECLKRGISVTYFSKGGAYFGRLQSMQNARADRQRMQCRLYETDFALRLAKNIITGKLHNQNVVLRRYAKSKKIDVDDITNMLLICAEQVNRCATAAEIMGNEGQGAKAYFEGLSRVIDDDFKFHGRSKRPPKDEFNSMIGLGYYVILNEICAKIEAAGLNPYFGFLHSDKEKHPTLASDLMEEWRPIIVDSSAMSLINGHEISKQCFTRQEIDGKQTCYLARDGIKIFLGKLEKKLRTEVRYLNYVDYPVDFRHAMHLQVNSLVHAIENSDSALYEPITIR